MHRIAMAFCVPLCLLLAGGVSAQDAKTEEFQPYPGQAGKDVVWVPTPPALVDKMLDMVALTPEDFVMDLGSGDGRNIIAAAKRGAHGVGVEYNPEMVKLAQKKALDEGVADKAKFVEGDMYEADISKATVLAIFLLPDNLRKLTPKFLDTRPGTRIVSNGFQIPGWDHDEVGRSEGECGSWCTAYLYIVPAKVEGTWRMGGGELTIEEQKFQTFSGTFTANGTTTPIRNGRLKGEEIVFSVGMTDYAGRVRGTAMTGHSSGSTAGAWRAVRDRATRKEG